MATQDRTGLWAEVDPWQARPPAHRNGPQCCSGTKLVPRLRCSRSRSLLPTVTPFCHLPRNSRNCLRAKHLLHTEFALLFSGAFPVPTEETEKPAYTIPSMHSVPEQLLLRHKLVVFWLRPQSILKLWFPLYQLEAHGPSPVHTMF